MSRFSKLSFVFVVWMFASAAVVMAADPSDFAEVSFGGGVVNFAADVEYAAAILSVAGPDDVGYQQTFAYKEEIYYKLQDECGEPIPDGNYRYTLMLRPALSEDLQKALNGACESDEVRASCQARYLHRFTDEVGTDWTQTGVFALQEGKFVEDRSEEKARYPRGDGLQPEDHLVYDDAIITGSICVGFDCVNGESFGYCTRSTRRTTCRSASRTPACAPFPPTTGRSRSTIPQAAAPATSPSGI